MRKNILQTPRQWAMRGYRIKSEEKPVKVTTCGYGGRTEYYDYSQVMPDMYAIGLEIQRQKEIEQRKWDATPLFDRLNSATKAVEKSGHYNKWSLLYTMNLIASDQGHNLAKWADGDEGKYLSMCYDMAAAKLTDFDRPKFVRWYVGLD